MKKWEQRSAGMLFVVVLVLFTLAQNDSRKLDRLYAKPTAEKPAFPAAQHNVAADKASPDPLANIGYKSTGY
jgi:hypothetical protein